MKKKIRCDFFMRPGPMDRPPFKSMDIWIPCKKAATKFYRSLRVGVPNPISRCQNHLLLTDFEVITEEEFLVSQVMES